MSESAALLDWEYEGGALETQLHGYLGERRASSREAPEQ
jgi:hypothetical protein